MIAKFNNTTGVTDWAKVLFVNSPTFAANLTDIYVHNDNVWTMMVSNLNAFYYSFILLFDSDGNLLKKLSFISQSSPNPTNLLYFEAY